MIKKREVIVVGGGPAGMVAAIASARNGADTLLIEASGCLGGVATSGLLSVWGPFSEMDPCWDIKTGMSLSEKEICRKRTVIGKRIIRGIAEEILNKLVKLENARSYGDGFIPLNPETLKYLVEQMLDEAGAETLYYTQGVDVVKEGNKIKAVVTANKSGLQKIYGDIFIDGTGDGDLAAYAGAPFEKGREKDGQMQGVTLVFRLGGVKISGIMIVDRENTEKANVMFKKELAQNKVSDRYEVGCITLIPGMEGVVSVNSQHTFNIDGTNPENLTEAVIKGREAIREMAMLFKKYLKGFENSFLLDTATMVGIRETRRIIGDYILTKDDVLGAKKFKDTIGKNAYNVDVHLSPEEKAKLKIPKGYIYPPGIFLKLGTHYDIPYRCLVPKKVENLLVAGRCISATREAQGSIRIMPCCMVTGQAAGTAAALSLEKKVALKDLDIPILQKRLLEQGAVV